MKTKTISSHWFRRTARREERKIQANLDKDFLHESLPLWARGVRVEKSGKRQWAVIVTDHRGH